MAGQHQVSPGQRHPALTTIPPFILCYIKCPRSRCEHLGSAPGAHQSMLVQRQMFARVQRHVNCCKIGHFYSVWGREATGTQTCRGQRTDIGSRFLPSTAWAPVRELRPPGLAVSAFTSRLISLVLTGSELKMLLPVSQCIPKTRWEPNHPARGGVRRCGDSLQTERAINYFALFIRRTGVS